MKRGTRVGQAYVAITADGDGINEEIVDSVDEAGPGIDKAAKKQSKRYSDRFAKTLEALPEKVSKKLDQALGFEMEKTGARAGDRAGASFASSFGRRLAKDIGEELEIVIARQLDLFEESRRKVSGNSGGGGGAGSGGGGGGGDGEGDGPSGRVKQRLIKEYDFYSLFEAARVKLHQRANRAIDVDDEQLRKRQQAQYDQIIKSEQAKAVFIGKFEAARAKLREQSNQVILKDDEKLVKAQQALFNQLQRENARAIRENERTSRLANRTVSSVALGAVVGKAFGAGSRNDFLNFFGRTLGGIVTLTERVRVGASSMFKTFSEGFNNAAEGAGFFTRLLSGLRGLGGGGGGGLLAGLAGAAPAIITVTAALTIFTSVLSALLGIVTALTSAIVAGLIGGLTVLAGTLGAATVAGLLLTAAFMSMDDAQKEVLKASFKPLHEEMIGLGQVMLTQMIPYFDTWSKNLQEALLLAAPLAAVMGDAFGQAGQALTDFLSGPGFQQLSNMLTVYLPNIVTMMGVALGGFLDGLAGTFAAILPYVNQFAIYLADIAVRFSEWASSAQGQNAISTFVSNATEALKSLWNFTREFFGFLGDVLFSDEAINAGITIFDAMAEKFADFRDAVAEAAANGDLERWFDTAIEFGGDLWAVIEALGSAFIALSDSGVLGAVGDGLAFVAAVIEVAAAVADPLVSVLGFLAEVLDGVVNPADRARDALAGFADVLAKVDQLGGGGGLLGGLLPDSVRGGKGGGKGGLGDINSFIDSLKIPRGGSSLSSLIGSGRGALSRTTKDTDKYTNPYKKMAEDLIKEAPKLAETLRAALYELNRQIADVLRASATSLDVTQTRSGIKSQTDALIKDARAAVESARSAVSSAASSLASASSEDAAESALKKLKRAQKDLKAAQENQETINRAAKILGAQQYTNRNRISNLVKGLAVQNATLADYTSARAWIAGKLEKANQKLADAISLRDQYKTQVTDAANQFGGIMTTQAQVIGGIEQALTVTDITTNLQTRLDKIRKFQEDLRQLSAQGLSQAAYKQIVDAGVEDGSRFTEALLAGGTQAVGEVNNLVKQIGDVSGSLGYETSSRMYQAGVDAAQGLINGLTSQQSKLDAAASRLGKSIGIAVKKALGIKSPSTVLMGDMDYAGDGLAIGLNRQEPKVAAAAEALGRKIRIHPTTSVTAGDGSSAGVSGNPSGAKFRDLIVQTPTEDPHAVAMEVLNEVTGRIP